MEDFGSFVQKLKSKLNIIDVCEKYVTLTQKGGRFWACCPFHMEKTPSMMISQEGYFHCFGCKESGDVIKFVQEMEGTDFMGAIEILAKMASMEIPKSSKYSKDDSAEKRQKVERLKAILKETALFYHRNMYKEEGKVANLYLENRGIEKKDFKRFGIGYSTDWESLVLHLSKLGYSKNDMVDSGVCDRKGGRVYDALGQRLIIPIIDSFKQVVAFGGRVLGKTDFAKYKNTKETEVFSKSKVLYGLNLVKDARKLRKIPYLIVVEGYMDAISLYQVGYDNVVASMGTALTKEQARLMKFIVGGVYISFDGDFAGQKASVRSLDILEGEGLDVKVVVLEEGLDPDDTIKKYGKDGYQKAIDEAMPLIDFKLHILRRESNLLDTLERRKYTLNALKLISNVGQASIQSELCERLSSEVGVNYNSLIIDLEKLISGKKVEIVQEKIKEKKLLKNDKGKMFLLYMLLSRQKEWEQLKESQIIFSEKERIGIEDFVENKYDISMVFQKFENIAIEILENSEIEGKEKYFNDIVKGERKKFYDSKISNLVSTLSGAGSEEKIEITKEINKFTRMKKLL